MADVNRDMNFQSSLTLSVDEIENQPTKRFFAKVMFSSTCALLCLETQTISFLDGQQQSVGKTESING